MAVSLPKNNSSSGLEPKGRQLDADPGLLLHPRDVVTTGATVLPHQLLAPGDVGGLFEAGHQLGVGLGLGAQGHQVGSEGQRLFFGQPQARHPGVGIVALGIAQPVVGPAGIHLGGDVLQVRHQILAGDTGGELALGKAVTPLAPHRAGQLLALLHHGGVAGPVALGCRMLLEPRAGLFLGYGPQVGCRRQRLVFLEEEVRHTGMRPERARVQDPLDHPAGIHLGADPSEARSHLGDIVVTLDQVAAGTTRLLEDLLSPSHHLGALKALDVEVAGNAVGLHVVALEQRMLPELHVAVRLRQAVDALSLSVMAGGAPEDPRRVSRVTEENPAFGMGLEGMRQVVETVAVDGDVARLATVHPVNLLVEIVAVEVLEHHLLDLGDLVERELRKTLRAHRDGGVVHLPLRTPYLALHLVDLFLDGLDAALDLRDLLLDVHTLLAGGLEGRLQRMLDL